MRLSDLEPAWLHFHEGPPRCGLGFRCPCKPGCTERLHVMFDVSIDDVPAPPMTAHGALQWKRDGKTFETLSLSPSIDATGFGHWHGWIRNGEMVTAEKAPP